MNDYKKLSTPQERPPARSEYDDALATMGMRIRKAVAEGYNVPSNHRPEGFNRQPLPSHMDQPPSLTNMGSTMNSSMGSNLAEWNQPPVTIPMGNMGTKRKHEDEPEIMDQTFDQGMNFNGLNRPQYGELKFNEDF